MPRFQTQPVVRFTMAKSLFYFAFCACLVATSKQQQSRERQLEAFRLAQSVDKQVQIARDLSGKLESLLNVARSELNNIGVSKGLNESTLNATLQPYASVILDALQTANSANSSAAKDCVAKARASIAQLITSAVNKEVLDCQTKTRIKLSNFILKLTSLYNAQGSTFSNALSDCPYSFFIESASDLQEARVCYTAANNTIKSYISQTMKDLEESVVTFNALQGNSCLSLGVEVAVKQAQAAVASMVACGKAAGVWLAEASVSNALRQGYADLEEYVADARIFIKPFYAYVQDIDDKINAIDLSLESEYLNTLQETLDLIDFVQAFLNDSTNEFEKMCVREAKAKYDAEYHEVVHSARSSISDKKAGFSAANLNVTDKNLQTLLDKAVAEAAVYCTSKLPLTAESVNNCFDEEFYQLQNNVWGVLQGADAVQKNADKLYNDVQSIFESHAERSIQNGNTIINELADCLEKENIEFTFYQKAVIST